MNNRKLVYALIAAALVIALIVLLIRVVSGAVSVVSSGFNAVLGVVVVLALVIIVIWMFPNTPATIRRGKTDRSVCHELLFRSLPRRLKDGVSYAGGLLAGVVMLLLCFPAPTLCAGNPAFDKYGRFLLAALFGAFLFKAGLPREQVLRLHFCYLLWLLLSRWLNGDVYLFIDWKVLRYEFISFLMLSAGILLPPEGRRRLLNVLSLGFGCFFVLFSLMGLFVAFTNTYFHIPPENVWITIRAEGNPRPLLNLLSSFRLTGAGRLYLAWGLLAYQAVRTRKTGLRVLLVLGMLVLHLAVALCLSHTTVDRDLAELRDVRAAAGIPPLAMKRWKPALRALVLAVVCIAVIPAVYKSFELSLQLRDRLQPALAARFEQRYESWERKPDPEYFGVAAPEQPITGLTVSYSSEEEVAATGDIFLETPKAFNQKLTLSSGGP